MGLVSYCEFFHNVVHFDNKRLLLKFNTHSIHCLKLWNKSNPLPSHLTPNNSWNRHTIQGYKLHSTFNEKMPNFNSMNSICKLPFWCEEHLSVLPLTGIYVLQIRIDLFFSLMAINFTSRRGYKCKRRNNLVENLLSQHRAHYNCCITESRNFVEVFFFLCNIWLYSLYIKSLTWWVIR